MSFWVLANVTKGVRPRGCVLPHTTIRATLFDIDNDMSKGPTRRLLVVGATGNIGTELVREALKASSPFTHVRALARDTSKISHLGSSEGSSNRLELVDCNAYDVDGLDAACNDVDSIVCAYRGVPNLALDAQLLLMRVAERRGVNQMILASWNYDVTKIKLGDHEPYDAYVSILAQTEFIPNLKVLFVVSGVFFDVLWWFGIWKAEKGYFETFGTGDEVWKLTSREDAARFSIEALRDRNRSGIVHIASEQLSLNDISKLVAEVREGSADKAKPVKSLGSADDCHAEFVRTREELGKPRYLEYAWLGYVYYTITGKWDFEPTDNAPLLEGATSPWQLSKLKDYIIKNSDAIDHPPEKVQ